MDDCSHQNEIIDYHEGTIVCTDCGIIKDFYFENTINPIIPQVENNSYGEIENVLDRLHIPDQFSNIINNNLSSRITKKSRISRIDNTRYKKISSVKKIATEIYNVVNQSNSILLLKDILNLSHLEPKQIKSCDITIINLDEILERYTRKFDLNYKTFLQLKEKVSQFNNTGFQPLTIIASVIYLYHIEIGKKISMKKIASLLGISSISIQRFIKKNYNALSPRS